MSLFVQIGALSDHYLLARRGRSSVSKRLAPKHTAALNADSRASIALIVIIRLAFNAL